MNKNVYRGLWVGVIAANAYVCYELYRLHQLQKKMAPLNKQADDIIKNQKPIF